jgi:hypothetical protein
VFHLQNEAFRLQNEGFRLQNERFRLQTEAFYLQNGAFRLPEFWESPNLFLGKPDVNTERHVHNTKVYVLEIKTPRGAPPRFR